MKILIIGASGMLAKPVIHHLDNAGFQLRLFSRTINSLMFDKEFEIIKGDVFIQSDLVKAVDGCDAIHITLSKTDEAKATLAIVNVAIKKGVQLISMISGCTVTEENRWFGMIENKYQAEQAIIKSGINYMIFRPTWFFETLDLMVRNGKAIILGKQPYPSHWIAADDYARMLAIAYNKNDAKNKIFYIHGPQTYLMKDLLEKYCKVYHPEIKKVSSVPLNIIKLIAALSRNYELKEAVSLFGYFEKVKELGNPEETNSLLGKPVINFEKWIDLKKLSFEKQHSIL